MMKILLEARSDDEFAGDCVASYVLFTMDNSTVQRLRELVTAVKMFGEQCGKQFAKTEFGQQWLTNLVEFSTYEALPGATVQWFKYTETLEEATDPFEAALKDEGWAIVPDDFEVKDDATDADGEEIVLSTELDYLRIWPRDGDIRFVAHPRHCEVEMWAGDLNLDKLPA